MFESEFEAELEGEFEGEFEAEWEGELEGEHESEEFFRGLESLGARAIRSPQLRRLGLWAGRTALRQGLPALGGMVGGRYGARGGQLGRDLGAAAGNLLSSYLPEREFEAEVNPLRRVQSRALMEHLGHAAAEAESEAEAEAFIGALIPLAARLAPRVAPIVMRAAPGMIRGLAGVARTLRRSPTTRRLVRVLPTIARNTTVDLARRVARGQSVSSQQVVRSLARQTARTLGSPSATNRAWRQSRALDRQYHRAVGDLPPAGGAAPSTCCTCQRPF